MLEIDLSYYDATHQLLLNQGSYKILRTASRVNAFRKIGKISKGDFFNYLLIHRAKSPAYQSYNQRIAFLGQAVGWISGVLDTNTTIKTLPGCETLQEHVGEAVCLSVASVMFNLTAADWAIIPIQAGKNAHKTFDFERALTGITNANEIVQVEAKGSFVSDNAQKCKKIYSHSGSITKKKKNIASKAATYKHPATARYGMIAAIDPVNNAKCWLLDPPPDSFEGDPRRTKIANRIDYVADVISLLAPNAHLPDELRLRAQHWRNGEPMEVQGPIGPPYTSESYVEKFLAKGKIWLAEHDIVGQLFLGDEDKIFFIGILGNVIRNAITQDIEAILDGRQDASSLRITIKGAPIDIGTHTKAEPLEASLKLHVTSSGTVIGIAETG